MKCFSVFIQLVLLILLASIFVSCSSVPEKPVKDEYFEPVEQVVHKSEEPGAPPRVVTRIRKAVKIDEEVKNAILDMIKDQNKRLDEVAQQLNATNQNAELVAALKHKADVDELLTNRNQVTNEILSEMIKDQNRRLDGIIEQLKILLQNQRVTHSEVTSPVNNALPPMPEVPPISVSRHLNVSLRYGKAIQLYENRKYAKAIRAFKKLSNQATDVKLIGRCRFWMGVCYFHLKKTNEAINAFKEVLSLPGSDKAECSRFMMGQCYEQMGAKKLAQATFEQMLREFPQGNLKQVAEIKLALLK